jgi:type II secretory pathway component PulC
MRSWSIVSLVLALPLAACKPKVDPLSPFDVEADGRGAARATPAEPATKPEVAPAGEGVRAATLDRPALARGLAMGPPSILQQLEVTADTVDQRFLGWRLVRLLEASTPLLRSLDLRPGDVLVSINGNPLSKPNELMDLWTELSAAAKIDCQLTRDGRPFSIVVEIVDPAPAPTT